MIHLTSNKNERNRALLDKFFYCFPNWTDPVMMLQKQCNYVSGLGEGLPDYVYFVLRGECVTIEILQRQQTNNKHKKSRGDKKSANIFAQICFFLEGATFNLGNPSNVCNVQNAVV
jgi:hypothetical protein